MVSRADDRAVLDELAGSGDKPEIPREFRVWIYGTTRDLGEVCRRLEPRGWIVVSFVADMRDEKERDTELIISRSQAADEQTVSAMSDEIEAALVGTSAVYDGWETSIETGANGTLH
nr:hypothetical protein [Sphingomonas sp.]